MKKGGVMRDFAKKLAMVFSSGCLGGLVNSLVVWVFGREGLTGALNVKIAPDLTSSWLYPRLIWGGVWGILFLCPLLKNQFFLRGFLFSLGPTIVQLFWVFPQQAHKGMLGLDLGLYTPLFVLFFNVVWGLTTALWLRFIGGDR